MPTSDQTFNTSHSMPFEQSAARHAEAAPNHDSLLSTGHYDPYDLGELRSGLSVPSNDDQGSIGQTPLPNHGMLQPTRLSDRQAWLRRADRPGRRHHSYVVPYRNPSNIIPMESSREDNSLVGNVVNSGVNVPHRHPDSSADASSGHTEHAHHVGSQYEQLQSQNSIGECHPGSATLLATQQIAGHRTQYGSATNDVSHSPYANLAASWWQSRGTVPSPNQGLAQILRSGVNGLTASEFELCIESAANQNGVRRYGSAQVPTAARGTGFVGDGNQIELILVPQERHKYGIYRPMVLVEYNVQQRGWIGLGHGTRFSEIAQLSNISEPAFPVDFTSIRPSIRIKLPGYQEWYHRQVWITKQVSETPEVMTAGELVDLVAAELEKAITKYSGMICEKPEWTVGHKRGVLSLDNFYLLNVVRTSDASFQPTLGVIR